MTRYHWQLVDARAASGTRLGVFLPAGMAPLELWFGKGRSLVAVGCNTLTEHYDPVDGRLRQNHDEGSLVTRTLLGCGGYSWMRDEAILTFLNGHPEYELRAGDGREALPTLELQSDSGDRLTFLGQPTAQTRYGNAGELIYFDIAQRMVPCASPGKPMRNCLQVRQLFRPEADRYSPGQSRIADGEAGPWQLLYEPIEGLDVRADEDLEGHGLYIQLRRFRRPAGSDQTAYVYVTVDR